MKTQNRGFTLVELVVVITIIGILGTIAGLSITTATSARARRTASEINSVISMARTKGMSREGNVYIVLRRDGHDIVCDYYEGVNEENNALGNLQKTRKLGGSEVSWSVDGETLQDLDENGLLIAFDRSTGALKYPDKDVLIAVSGGRTFNIEIVALTGSHGII